MDAQPDSVTGRHLRYKSTSIQISPEHLLLFPVKCTMPNTDVTHSIKKETGTDLEVDLYNTKTPIVKVRVLPHTFSCMCWQRGPSNMEINTVRSGEFTVSS